VAGLASGKSGKSGKCKLVASGGQASIKSSLYYSLSRESGSVLLAGDRRLAMDAFDARDHVESLASYGRGDRNANPKHGTT
jgi:hypothetical protein